MSWNDDLETAFNAQTTMEFASSYQYLALAAWLEEASFPGMANWMRQQASEEWAHGMRFHQFILDRDGSVSLGTIDAPASAFSSPLEVFTHALEHERRVTAGINELYGLATDVRDFASLPFLDWFVSEQVEEEATMLQIVDDLQRAAAEGHALLMLDRELGARAPAPQPG